MPNSAPPLVTPTQATQKVFEVFLRQPGRKPSTKDKYRYKLKEFLGRYGDLPIAEISAELLETWFTYLEEQKGYSPGNLAFHRNCFHAFFNYTSLYTGHNPARTLPHYSSKPTHVITANPQEVEKAINICETHMWSTLTDQRDAAIFILGTAGLRRSNVKKTRLSQVRHALANPITVFDPVSQSTKTMYVIPTDGKGTMEAVLDERRARIVRRYIENRPKTRHDKLFINLDPRSKLYRNPLSNEGLLRARVKVCKEAKVTLTTFQKMRRLVGTKVARTKGAETAAKVLGHKSGTRVVLDHYFNPDTEAARLAALQALD